MLNFIREKSYYLLLGTVLIIVLLIVLFSCSNKKDKLNSYSAIENKMVEAAKEYYNNRKDKLPTLEGNTEKVTISTLIEAELMDKVYDPNNKSNACSGYVEVSKVESEYAYIPILTCEGSYEPKHLVDAIKQSGKDEYGNGIYEVNNKYIYKGESVNNYIEFSNNLWRIISVDSNNDIKLVYYPDDNRLKTTWDTKYNSEIGKNYGITTDYFQSNVRKALKDFYENYIETDAKLHMVSKNICIGRKLKNEDNTEEKECSKVQENEKVSLINISDYVNASLGEGCKDYRNLECTNRNYIASSTIDTWLLNAVEDNSYEVYYLNGTIRIDEAKNNNLIYPVIYLSKKVIISSGDGTRANPYIVK